MLQDEALLHPESHKPVMRYLVQLVSKLVYIFIAISSFISHGEKTTSMQISLRIHSPCYFC